MEKLKSLLNDPKRLAKLLMVDRDLQGELLQALQDERTNKAVVDFLKSSVCSAKVIESILEYASRVIIGGLNEPNPTPFDMYSIYAIAYASGLVEAIRQYKI